MKLSIIIPCYNEKGTILDVLGKVGAAPLPPGVGREIVVVCDGSTDGTRELLEKNYGSGVPGVKVLYHETNYGKGRAVQTGAAAATGDYLVVQDADLELTPADYPALLRPVIEDKAEVVFGSRAKFGFSKMYAHSRFANRVITGVTNLLYGSRLSDQACGYKLLSMSAFRSITLDRSGFEFCSEITAKLLKRGYAIQEVPVEYFPRSYSQGKKVNWRDGFRALWTLAKYRIFG